MKKLLVCTSILTALGLTGCGGDTIEDIQSDNPSTTPVSRIVFDPANGDLNIPNDLLMLPGDDGFFDYTLNIPVADPSDFSDPQNALNVLDGWSTNYPMQVNVNVPNGVSIDESTLTAGIKIYEATLGLDINDPDCAQIQVPSAGCKVGRELQFGVDYVMQLADADTVNIVPLRPLKPAQGHMLVMTTGLKDSTGKAIQGSTTWGLVKQDINENPLATDSQLQLQALVNTFVDALAPVGFTREELTYVSAFTTQSIDNVLSTIKQLQVAEFAQLSAMQNPAAGAALPAIVVNGLADKPSAMEALGLVSEAQISGAIEQAVAATPALGALQAAIDATNFTPLTTCDGLLAGASNQYMAATGQTFGPEADAGLNQLAQGVSTAVLGQVGPLCASSVYEANISLPYYSPIPRAENPLAPANEFWEAACDSGVVLQASLPVLTSPANDITAGPNAALCQSVGLDDVRVNGELLDRDRRLTKFNPIPQMKGGNEGKETLDVQVTLPNMQVAAALGVSLQMPENGWPVVMLVHGITSEKEAMLSISGALSLAGFATIAIDQPVHGSRGFDLTGDGIDDFNATSVSATHFLNLASLPTARDNSRQAVADLLGVRLGLNAVVDATGTGMVNVNGTDVSVMGVSLGAITGGMFASLANTPFEGQLAPLSGLYGVQAASLESPGGGLATFLLDSPAFGPLIKAFLLSEASPDFQAALVATYGPEAVAAGLSEPELVAVANQFLGALSPEQAAAVNGIFGQFAFAAQTMTDSSDPINYFETLGANTPVHMLTVVGDGGNNLPDQVIPVTTALPTSGQLPLAALMNLQEVVSTVQSTDPISGLVQYTSGAHASSLNPVPDPAVTVEMQTQVATYLATKARVIQVNNTDVVKN